MLAARLKEARDYLGLSQEEVAQVLGVPRSAISLFEKGERRVDALELKRLAQVYQRPLDYFTGNEVQSELSTDVFHLARAASALTTKDREELLRFAEFLQSKGRTEGKK